MAPLLVRVFFVQCVTTGHFLDWEQNLVKSYRHAAITDDQQNAIETAMIALGADFEIHSAYVTQERLDMFHSIGFN
jgi:hypothetical protein